MIDYDSFSRCHPTDLFFRFSRGSKRVKIKMRIALGFTLAYKTPFCKSEINNLSLAIYKN